MEKLKEGATALFSWLKGVDINKSISSVQLKDRHGIIMDQLLTGLTTSQTVELFKKVKGTLDEAMLKRDEEVKIVSTVINEYKEEFIFIEKKYQQV
jgi:hypothetical protein